MTVGELKVTLSAETKDFEKQMDLATAALENIEEKGRETTESMIKAMADMNTITESILESVPSTMESIMSAFESYVPQMTDVGRQMGEGIANGIAGSLANVEMYTGAQDTGDTSTYNTYNTTYNAGNSVSSGVSIADFENRIRRAYA